MKGPEVMTNSTSPSNPPVSVVPGDPREGPPPIGLPVDITVNGTVVQIHSGRRTVVQVKDAGHVAHADVLEQVIHGQLNELPDDGSVVIKGHEVFVSHVRGSSSS